MIIDNFNSITLYYKIKAYEIKQYWTRFRTI
jgi:hypothetical protein